MGSAAAKTSQGSFGGLVGGEKTLDPQSLKHNVIGSAQARQGREKLQIKIVLAKVNG
jgi:hypothetical protein